MPTMVDAWGVSAHCDICSAEADENDLEDDSAGRMACGRCRGHRMDDRGCVHCDGEFRVNIEGENLCQHHADEWVRGEGMAANEVAQGESSE